MKTSFHASLVLAAGIRVSTHQDGAVMLDINGGQVYSTNRVGAEILSLIEKGDDLDAIAERIGKDFDVPIERIRVDVRNFLDSLRFRGLLRLGTR
jgi:hypothetical protein